MRRLTGEFYRHMQLGIISPYALTVFAIIRVVQLCGGRYEKIMPADYQTRRIDKVAEGKSLGWVEETRIYRLKIAGFKIIDFRISKPETLHILNFYFLRNCNFLQKDFDFLKSQGCDISLNDGMRIFEPGCNMGRMLFFLKDMYKARITGIDIYKNAIDMVALIKAPQDEFFAGDIINSDFLKTLPDNHFDLSIASSFINHVSHLPGYNQFLDQLARTSKQIYIHDRAFDHADALDRLNTDGWKSTTIARGKEIIVFAKKIL